MAIDKITGAESVEELQRQYALAEGRIRMLDEKREYTKPEIYQKVRAEYEAKLFELRVLLEEKGAGVQEALDAATAEKGALVARHHQIGDELEELELRAVIGELDEADFAARQQALQQEQAEIDAQVEQLTTTIENYQQLLGGAAAPAAEEAPAPAPKPPAVEPPAPQPRPAPRPVVAPAVAPVRPVPPPPAAPRPAAVSAPAPEPVRPAPQPAAAPRPPAPAPRPAPKPPAPHPVEPEPAPAPADAAPAPTAEMEELERQFASILSSTMAESPPVEQPSMQEVFAPAPSAPAPEPAPAEEGAPADGENHEGELKCPKCQAFNRADNWYCEKCGNELLNANDLLGGAK